jgi:S-adenosylmethionine decarboxylase
VTHFAVNVAFHRLIQEFLWTPMKTLSVKIKEPSPAQREFCGREGDIKYAGIHILAELWHAKHLTDASKIRSILVEAIEACGATMLSIDLHVFSPNGGVSGIAILKESHISIHTWPEFDYAAVDIFVCGTVNPHHAVTVLKSRFQPERMDIQVVKRGILP